MLRIGRYNSSTIAEILPVFSYKYLLETEHIREFCTSMWSIIRNT